MTEGDCRVKPATAKLVPPRIQHVFLRPDTLDALERSTCSKLTLVCAPAGYGKTTAVAAAFQQMQIEPIWYKLDVLDHDATMFLGSLVDAFRTRFPAFGQTVLERLRFNHESPISIEQFAALFVDECEANVQRSVSVVIDDYHEAADSLGLNRMLDCLLAFSPDSIRFFVLSRYEPAFPTGKMRLAGQMSVIGVEHLRFNRDQATRVLEMRAGRRFPHEHVERLVDLTEGWPASIVLAGMALDWLDLDSLDQVLSDPRMKGDIYSYLAEQVYQNEDGPTRDFLDRTCCLGRITAKLANRLAGIEDAHSYLHHLAANRVFTFVSEPGSYRYHTLFGEFLKHHYLQIHGEAAVRALQVESATALERSGDAEMAVELLFSANEPTAALEVLARAGEPGLENFRTESLITWLQRLSCEMQVDEPWARLLSSQIHMRAGDLEAALADVDRAVMTCEKRGDEWGLYHALSVKECALFWKGDLDEGIATCSKALTHASTEAQRMHTLLSLGSAAVDRRDWPTAEAAFAAAETSAEGMSLEERVRGRALRALAAYTRGDFRSASSLFPQVPDGRLSPMLTIGVLHGRALTEAGLAHYRDALTLFREVQNVARARGLVAASNMVEDNVGVILSGLGRFEDGLAMAERTANYSRSTSIDPILTVYALDAEATILRRMGRYDDSLVTLERANGLVTMERDPYMSLSLRASIIFVRTLIDNGLAEGLTEIAEEARAAGLEYVSLSASLYQAILLARDKQERAGEALASCIEEQLRLGHIDLIAQELCPRPEIAVLALQSLESANRQRDLMEALACHWRFPDVLDCLKRSAPSMFLEMMPSVIVGTTAQTSSDARSLDSNPVEGGFGPVSARPSLQSAGFTGHPDVAALTKREREVLRLMAIGLRNPEIAAQLYLSNATVKTHVNHIFCKLGVTSRVQAILKCKATETAEGQLGR